MGLVHSYRLTVDIGWISMDLYVLLGGWHINVVIMEISNDGWKVSRYEMHYIIGWMEIMRGN